MNTKKELMDYIEWEAKNYLLHVNKTFSRNKHLHKYKGKINIKYTEAILVDFINCIGISQGLDWATNIEYIKAVKD